MGGKIKQFLLEYLYKKTFLTFEKILIEKNFLHIYIF